MSELPILIVAGFGRCGTTLMMHMLRAGGFACVGQSPAFEPDQMLPGSVDLKWLFQQSGRAVKWIDPQRTALNQNTFTGRRPIIIHMTRDARQQAKSQVKMLASDGSVTPNRSMIRAMASSIERDRPKLDKLLNAVGRHVYSFSFEWILSDPQSAADKVRLIIDTEFDQLFDSAKAATVPINRSADCAANMDIELAMLGH